MPPDELTESLYYLSSAQRERVRSIEGLAEFADHLPCWVPHRRVAAALGHGFEGIEAAEARIGMPYVWATEFENVHSLWQFDEPAFADETDGLEYGGSEQFFQAHKHKAAAAADSGGDALSRFAKETKDIRCAIDPMEAYTLGRLVDLRRDWDEAKDEVMARALRNKFGAACAGEGGGGSSSALMRLLMSTGHHPLVSVKPDSYWGIGLRGQGLNRLGSLLEDLRNTAM